MRICRELSASQPLTARPDTAGDRRIPAGAPHAECSEYQRVALRQGYPAASQWHTSDAQIPLELETVARDYHDLDAECIHHRYVVRNRRENRILDRLPSDAKPAVRNMLRCILVRGTCMTSYAWAVEWGPPVPECGPLL